ncbi:MAG: hypothetical protein ACP5PZ_12300, partial [Bacteroidales bacterium]
TNSQNLNRYSYCLNNPLKYTDPTGYRTWWDNFKAWVGKNKVQLISTGVTIAVAAIVTAATGGLGAPVAAMLGGMAGGFAGGMLGAKLNHASWSDAWWAAMQGVAIGGISASFTACVGSVMQGAFMNIGNVTLQTVAREGTRALLHGAVQGYLTAMQGGSFWSGFVAGSFSSLSGSLIEGFHLGEKIGTAGQIGVGALTGGTAAYLSGGDFAMGAISGAWVVMFNHMMHGGKTLFKKIIDRIKDPNKPIIPGIYKTSAENIGYQLRRLDEALDGRTNGGKVPAPVKFIANLNPLVSIPSGVKTIMTGSDIYNQPVKGQYSQGAWMIFSGISGFTSPVPPISPKSIIIDQSVPLILDKVNAP